MSNTRGERIRRLREAKGWLQDELAQKMGLNRETLSKIENNHRSIKDEELNRFADVLEVSCDQLLGRIPLDEVNLDNVYPSEEAKEVMRISVPASNVQKFREVLLYILNKVGAKSNVGETVIYKLLYFIDFDFYEKYEEQLVGATYKKNTFGPTPIEYAAIVSTMIADKEITKIPKKYFDKEQKKYLPLRKPNLDCLSGKEIVLIDEVLNRLADKNATQISEYSHGDIPWKVTKDMEVIDYETVFYRTAEYSVRNNENE
ncbi:MAG: type II toxin-antitoxin system antitoxin SocA domain-containing protein [Simkaniaceae bacterium]